MEPRLSDRAEVDREQDQVLELHLVIGVGEPVDAVVGGGAHVQVVHRIVRSQGDPVVGPENRDVLQAHRVVPGPRGRAVADVAQVIVQRTAGEVGRPRDVSAGIGDEGHVVPEVAGGGLVGRRRRGDRGQRPARPRSGGRGSRGGGHRPTVVVVLGVETEALAVYRHRGPGFHRRPAHHDPGSPVGIVAALDLVRGQAGDRGGRGPVDGHRGGVPRHAGQGDVPAVPDQDLGHGDGPLVVGRRRPARLNVHREELAAGRDPAGKPEDGLVHGVGAAPVVDHLELGGVPVQPGALVDAVCGHRVAKRQLGAELKGHAGSASVVDVRTDEIDRHRDAGGHGGDAEPAGIGGHVVGGIHGHVDVGPLVGSGAVIGPQLDRHVGHVVEVHRRGGDQVQHHGARFARRHPGPSRGVGVVRLEVRGIGPSGVDDHIGHEPVGGAVVMEGHGVGVESGPVREPRGHREPVAGQEPGPGGRRVVGVADLDVPEITGHDCAGRGHLPLHAGTGNVDGIAGIDEPGAVAEVPDPLHLAAVADSQGRVVGEGRAHEYRSQEYADCDGGLLLHFQSPSRVRSDGFGRSAPAPVRPGARDRTLCQSSRITARRAAGRPMTSIRR